MKHFSMFIFKAKILIDILKRSSDGIVLLISTANYLIYYVKFLCVRFCFFLPKKSPGKQDPPPMGQTPPNRIACDGERLNSKLNSKCLFVCSIVFQGHMAAKILIFNFFKFIKRF